MSSVQSRDWAAKRILADMRTVLEVDSTHYRVVDYRNIHRWIVIMTGPEGSAFEDIQIVLYVYFPKTYPFDAPTIRVGGNVFHPNIYPVTKFFALDQLQWNHWKPHYDAHMVLELVHYALKVPSITHIVNYAAAKKFQNKVHYELEVRVRMEKSNFGLGGTPAKKSLTKQAMKRFLAQQNSFAEE